LAMTRPIKRKILMKFLTPTTGVGKRAAFDNPFACNC